MKEKKKGIMFRCIILPSVQSSENKVEKVWISFKFESLLFIEGQYGILEQTRQEESW